MILGALLLLATPAQATAPQAAPSLGDPRRRGGARDLFEQDDGDDPAVRQTSAFALRPTGVEHVGPLAITNTGRYATYGLAKASGKVSVVVVDTASATVRAKGPELAKAADAMALSNERLFVASDGQLLEQPWFAAESARRAWAAPSPEVTTTPLPGAGRTRVLLVDESAGRLALLAQSEAGWAVHTRALDGHGLSSTALELPPGARCADMTFAGEGLFLVVACQGPSGAVAIRLATAGGPARSVALRSPDQDAQLTSVAVFGTKTVSGWESGSRGALILHGSDGRATKQVPTDKAPRALHVIGSNVVVVERDGSVWLVGLSGGATRLGVESPELGKRGAAQSRPIIATDGGTVLLADDGGPGARPTLWVVPAIQ